MLVAGAAEAALWMAYRGLEEEYGLKALIGLAKAKLQLLVRPRAAAVAEGAGVAAEVLLLLLSSKSSSAAAADNQYAYIVPKPPNSPPHLNRTFILGCRCSPSLS